MVVHVPGAAENAATNAAGPRVAGGPSTGRGAARPAAAALLLQALLLLIVAALLLAVAAAGVGCSGVACLARIASEGSVFREQLSHRGSTGGRGGAVYADKEAPHAVASSHVGIIWCRGCSLSSVTVKWTREFVRLHGLRELAPPDYEFFKKKRVELMNKGKNGLSYYCKPSRPVEVNYTWSENGMQRLKQAASVLKGEFACSSVRADAPTVMLMKSSGLSEVDEFIRWARPDTVRITFNRRRNLLDMLICGVKDCFNTYAGHPVDGDGRRRAECFQRREDKLADGDYMVYLKPKTIARHLAQMDVADQYGRISEQLYHNYGNIPFVDVEDMFEFEYSPDPAVLRRSVAAWARHLGGLGVPPDEGVIESHLRTKVAGGIRRHHGHRTEIYNWREVKDAVLGIPSMSWMWRD